MLLAAAGELCSVICQGGSVWGCSSHNATSAMPNQTVEVDHDRTARWRASSTHVHNRVFRCVHKCASHATQQDSKQETNTGTCSATRSPAQSLTE